MMVTSEEIAKKLLSNPDKAFALEKRINPLTCDTKTDVCIKLNKILLDGVGNANNTNDTQPTPKPRLPILSIIALTLVSRGVSTNSMTIDMVDEVIRELIHHYELSHLYGIL